ncbi:hypothetical protein GCM10025770_27700 [Viridibacterium curvum]|uniref:Uncharacterized protein n=1 Tax=Viridibacterium curvum TaxID=1101404 RepID=A0ABP9QVV2_9RHOO
MRKVAPAIIACALACASTFAQAQNQYGKFVLFTPVGVEAPELSMRWQFGLMLNIDPDGVESVRFSCNQMPGSAFTVKMSDMQRKNGGFYTEGPVTAVSSKNTPWLYAPSYIFTTCNATIHTTSNGEVTISGRLSYTEEQKAEILQKLKASHDSKAKKP